jgi:hypothetical protein
VFDDGNAARLVDEADQSLAAARDDEIDRFVLFEQFGDGVAVGGGNQRNGGFGQAFRGERFVQRVGDGVVGVKRLGAAAQDDRVAGFEAEARRVGGHVGPRLVDHGDHAEGHAHPPDLDAAGPRAHVRPLADGIVERGDLPQRVRHLLDALGVEQQPVDHRVGQVVLVGVGEVFFVGVENGVLVRFQRVGHAVEHAVFRRRVEASERAGSVLCLGGEGFDGRFFGRRRGGFRHGGSDA